MENKFIDYIDEVSNNLDYLKENLFEEIEQTINYIKNSLNSGGKIIFFGNGGSASDSQHLCAEFVGRYKKNRDPLPAISLNTDTSVLTAVANDMGYEKVFERQVQALAKKEDVLFAISTSGKSKNILNAIKVANKKGLKIILLASDKAQRLNQFVDLFIASPGARVDRIQETHTMIGHLICELVEKKLFRN